MEIYSSEQEQVDALKAWWDKNGRITIVAIVAVLLGVLGWKSWVQNQQQRAEAASVIYQQMLDTLETDAAKAMELGRVIVADYPGTAYVTFASLAMAKLAVEQKELDGAAAYLRQAMEQADDQAIQQLARLRLARVLQAQGKAEEALGLLTVEVAPGIRGGYDELRGDILLAQGQTAAAREAYTNALSGYGDAPQKRNLVEMKLDDLAESQPE